MWKEFFYFSKGQRIGIVTLIILILIVFLANFLLPFFYPSEVMDGKAFINEVNTFKKSLVSLDSLKLADYKRKYEEKYNAYKVINNENSNSKYKLFAFDPNVLDSAGFTHLGLKQYVASNILKYRGKGGKFRQVNDFGKVYGISPEKFKELEPYIVIKEQTVVYKKDTIISKPKVIEKQIVVELNNADTADLKQIKGIGSFYAKAIVRFRNETGGFYSIEQLNEVFGMKKENYERIKPYCTANSLLVKKIKVNTASVDRLNAHLYINFYQAKAIYELRRKKGKLNSLNDLNQLSEFSTVELSKLSFYLNFE